jgi:phosphate:Na+ symporter
VHVLFNSVGTLIFMIALSIMQRYQVFGAAFWTMEATSTVIALFQTAFNVATCVLLLPCTNALVKLSTTIVKDDPQKDHPHPELLTLNENLYISPAVALGEATRAVAAMGRLAHSNFVLGCKQLVDYAEAEAELINENEDYLDQFADDSDHFLIGLSKVIESEQEDRQLDLLMQSVPNFERIGDYATNFVEMAQRLEELGKHFSEGARQELQMISAAVSEILEVTVDAFTRNDSNVARTVEPLEEVIDDMVLILQDRHTKRLKKGDCSVETGLVFMECLTYLERASDQCSSIAVKMLARDDDAILNNHHEYLRNVHAGKDSFFNQEMDRRKQQYLEPLKNIQL